MAAWRGREERHSNPTGEGRAMLHCHAEDPILAYFRPPRRDPTLRDAVLMISIQWSVLILFIATDVAAAETSSTISLSEAHIAAVNRPRRVIVNIDASWHVDRFVKDLPAQVDDAFGFADEPGSHIDSIWWSWGQGQTAPYPSKILPLYDREKYRRWVNQGIDVMRLYLQATRKRGLEAFFSYRLNAGDSDLGTTAQVAIKQEHPEWTIRPWPDHPTLHQVILFNFAFKPVRDYKLSVLREAAENYEFDGIELDMQRSPLLLPIGRQWENRHHLTQFVRSVRAMLQALARKRGRPFLLAVRLSHRIESCHFDGIDVETWAREGLVDMFVLGTRSLDVDVYAFRWITDGTHIKLYPVIQDHHGPDGYSYPPIEVFRGVFSNWYRQGADGIETFNFAWAPAIPGYPLPSMNAKQSKVHQQAYREMGDPELMKHKDKVFVLSRRGGGHGDPVVPNPEKWYTPRHMFGYTNMLAPLPCPLSSDGKTDTFLKLFVGDELSAAVDRISELRLRILLHDAAAGDYISSNSPKKPKPPDDTRIERGAIRAFRHRNFLYNCPSRKGIEKRLQLRIHNSLLAAPVLEDGWLVFHDLNPRLFAVGDNLIGAVLSQSTSDLEESIRIEKLELQVRYQANDESKPGPKATADALGGGSPWRGVHPKVNEPRRRRQFLQRFRS